MPKLTTLKFDNNIGGLNTRASDRTLRPDESPDLLNVKLTKYGAIVKESGYTYYNETPVLNEPAISGIYSYLKSSSGEQYLIVCAGTKMYTALSGIFTDVTRLSEAYTDNTIWDFVTFNDLCIAVNGEDAPQKFNGSTNAGDLEGAPPAGAAFVEVHQNRVFMAGELANPTKLSYSALSDPEDWQTENDAGWIEVGLNDGQKIVGIKSFFDVLLIFKEQSIYILTGSSGDPNSEECFSLTPMNASIGAVSNKSIIQVGNDLYFLSDKGVYTLQGVQSYGDLNVSNISFKIQSLIDGLNKSGLFKSFAINDYEENRIWFFLPDGSSVENNLILIYDYNLKAWTKRSGFSALCGHIFKDLSSSSIKFYTGSYDGFICHQKQGDSYADRPICAYYITPWLDLNNYRNRKKIRDIKYVNIPTGGHYMGVTYQWDYGNRYTGDLNIYLAGDASLWGEGSQDIKAAIWGQDLWDSAAALTTTKTINGGGNVLQLKFWNYNANESFILLGWYINLIERGIR